MLVAEGLSKQYGGQTLFLDASFRLDKGHVYGIVGANGAGKSTLLRILSGEEVASAGDVNVPRKARIGVLEQDHFKYEDTRILDVVMMGQPDLWKAMEEKEAMLAGPEEDFDVDRYSDLEDTVQRLGGYELEALAGEVLHGLNIPAEKHELPLSTLSGGYKLRVLLAQVLAAKPELLMLDEPTNHLDIVSLDWLEGFLRSYRGCVAVVSHDRRFLDNVCSDIVDVDYERIMLYKGNYSAFEHQKIEERGRKEAEISKREKEIAEHKQFIQRFKAKATKARQANSRVKRMAKIEIETLAQSSRRHPSFRFAQKRHSGREVLKVKAVDKAYGDDIVLVDVSLEIHRGDRVAIIGPNGIGKSTLLNIAVGRTEADGGEAEWGHEAQVGFFAQDNAAMFHGKQSVYGWLSDQLPGETIGFVRGKLAEVLFVQDDADKPITALSGGERARLVFALLGAQRPNVLVLDEPTNHLDLEAIESLAQGLEKYDGTLLFVSHDRWFVQRLATRIIEISEDGVFDFNGHYDDFVRYKNKDHLDAEQVLAEAKKTRKKKRKK